MPGGTDDWDSDAATPTAVYTSRDQVPDKYKRNVMILEREEILAKKYNIPWKFRGPPGPKDGGPRFWRDMSFRDGPQRWAKRGGVNLDAYNAKYGGTATSSKSTAPAKPSTPKVVPPPPKAIAKR